MEALNIGLGAKKEIVTFTSALDTLNHVTAESGADTVEVQIETLDSIVSKKLPALIKIDVEGFETEVLNGATEVLQASTLKAIIIELNGSGKRYGYDENNIHEKLIGHKFLPYNYNPIDRSFMKMETYGSHNTIYIRDMDFVKARVETSRSIKVGRGRQL